MKILVTGARGFVGQHLVQHFGNQGHSLTLVDRRSGSVGKIPTHAIELPNEAEVRDLIQRCEPDALVHLAGISSVPVCENQPDLAQRINVEATEQLAAAWRDLGGDGPFLFVSSAVVYGPTPIDDQPVTEKTLARPAHRYGMSKLEAEKRIDHLLADRALIFRPFNHFGPGQTEEFVVSSFAKQAAAISRGKQDPRLDVGNIDVQRDFLSVSDVVEAYSLGLEQNLSGTYVLASGRALALRTILDELQQLSEIPFRVEVDPARVRANDLSVLVGDSSCFQAASGWRPKVTVESAVREMFEYWLERV